MSARQWIIAVTTGTCLVALANCGGSVASAPGDGSSTMSSVGGQPFVAVDQIGQTFTAGHIASAGVVISNTAGLCGIAMRQGNPPNVATLAFAVEQKSAAVGPGTYPVYPVGTAVASFEVMDASCHIVTLLQATDGNVTLTTLNAEQIEGSYDLTLESGDRLTGVFSAPVCPVLLFQAAWKGTCGS
jgi:hypothetical protein